MTDEHQPAPRRWLRFSLRSLLLAAIVAALAISHVATSMKLRDARRNLEELRNEVGYLTIGDPTLVHVVAIPSAADREYRWRIYLPPGNKLSFMTAISQITDRGLPDLRQTRFNDRPFDPVQYGQEFILTVAIVRKQHGGWQFSWDDGVRNLTMPLPPDEYAFLDARTGVTHYVTGTRGTESFPPHEPIVLFKFRKSKVLPGGNVTVDTEPCPGILVWIEKRVVTLAAPKSDGGRGPSKAPIRRRATYSRPTAALTPRESARAFGGAAARPGARRHNRLAHLHLG